MNAGLHITYHYVKSHGRKEAKMTLPPAW